ncbi:gamma-glutamyltranspeptidase/glutathione hydrolase [Micromonospora sp. HB375]|uniref:gamma-glutamyltransferase family protein n=1 Tax=unclassified Micromonospora TaxID=2617518 RepID=UPI001AE0FFEC|nr:MULTISPECIES: gamma-glutamyltransferase family protein [unclassified Micromonospora]MBP1783380.1 gamma-glutamyltranspeptidase/glutathione hydrolase [Micromonospora sp. HB375]MDH6469029.1 gamma-glutamyltranspeptidase/glutathione hydrolase [Micromonospora sp. H404/HB375]
MTFTTRPTLRGTFGMVSSTHWLASQSAMGVLERGGNAFDAAVTAGFVLHVVEPHLNGPAGEVPAILATAADPAPRVLCGQGPAPAAATVAHFRSLGLDLVPGAGPLAAVVPGAVDAWLLLLRDHGTRTLAEVLEPAIGYAAAGHPLVGAAGQTVARVRSLFTDHWPTSARLWLRDGRPPAPGEMITNPAYADTLRRLVHAGRAAGADREAQIEAARRAWREGFVAEAIDRFSRLPFRDSSGRAHAGLVTGDDLAGFSATWEAPVTLDWRGHTIAKTGFWGQGPVLLQTLAVLDALDDPAVYDPSSLDGIHAQAEALKLAFADREAWYGDTDLPGSALLSAGYARSRAALIGDSADTTLRPGSPAGEPPRLPSHLHTHAAGRAVPQDPSTGEPTVRADGVTRGDTCHVDVVDRWGNIISATPSGGWLQSSPTIPELGFPLGSRLQMCWLEEGLASTLRPGRRPRTTLSPTLVLRDGEPVMACGTPGGDQQDQWQLLFLLRHLAGGQDLQEAIDAPTWHTTSFPASFYPREVEPGVLVLEDRIDADVLAGLRARGHTVRLSDPWSLGRMCAVTRDPRTGVLSAAANPRGAQGYATGR